jgi:hypothetical protein
VNNEFARCAFFEDAPGMKNGGCWDASDISGRSFGLIVAGEMDDMDYGNKGLEGRN